MLGPWDMYDLGTAKILSERTVTAGEVTTVVYRYVTGHPIDDTGYLKLAFRFAGDFGIPQWTDPRALDYVTVETDGDCRLAARWDPKGHTRPWGRCLILKVMGGYLDRGDAVTVTFGDTSMGSPGWRMQTFCEKTFEFKTLVDPIASYQFKELKRSPTLRIVPGKPARTLYLAPSQVLAGKPFTAWIKEEDRWGNPVGRPEKERHPGYREAGHYVLRRKGLTGEGSVCSNPIEVVDREAPAAGRYWADWHGQSEETIGTNSARDYFLFARDKARLDIASHQGNDFQMTDTFWEELNALTASLNKPGRFVTFPGYEWSANTALGGDRNVWFTKEGGPIIRSSLELIPGKASAWPVAPQAADLFRELHQHPEAEPFCAAHVGGRYADLRFHDELLEHAVEIHSAWGTFEWLLEESFERGYRVGICANSDGHKGRPGASYPGAGKFGSLGGLTCMRAARLDRESVAAAYAARHYYATTGHRPLLDVVLYRDGNPAGMMGDIVPAGEGRLSLRVAVRGTGPLERVEIWNGNRRRSIHVGEADAPVSGKRFQLLWGGAEVKGRGRLVSWDGELVLERNRIAAVEAINFLNPDQPLRRPSSGRLAWESTTTGGHAGMLLTLEKPARGHLYLRTRQKRFRHDLGKRSGKPRIWKCGGVRKQVELRPLPDEPASDTLELDLPVRGLVAGDNPLFVKVYQEDGHIAWSSPIYLVKATDERKT